VARKRAKATKRDRKEPRRWPAWKTVRAAIIAYFVAFNVLAAVPTPGDVNREKLSRPIARAELHRWVAILGSFGIDTEADALGQWYIDLAKSVESVRWTVLKPILWWMDFFATHQGWRLFGMPDERPYALQIYAVRRGEKELLYKSADLDHRWNASFLEYRRVRAVYNPGHSGPPTTYGGFGRRISEKVFDEMPDAGEVIVSVERSHTTLPGEPPDDTVEEQFPMVFERSAR
jgi:hypothetical protein